MTNNEFAKKNEDFAKACRWAKVPTTGRQASKFRMGKGSARQAWKMRLTHEARDRQAIIDAMEMEEVL